MVSCTPSALHARLAIHYRLEARAANAKEAAATSLPVDQGSFDAALCVQVLEYVPDVSAALEEMRRATSGMARILRAWDAHLAHLALPRSLGSRLRAAGFAGFRSRDMPSFP